MKEQLEILRNTRNNFAKVISSFSLEELNNTPVGFKNSLAWNYAHNIITMQLLVYGLSGKDMKINTELIDKYRKGTLPTSLMSEAELEYFKELSTSTIDDLESDYESGLFSEVEFKEYPTSYGYTLTSVETAIGFNNIHEGVHFGYALAMKKSV